MLRFIPFLFLVLSLPVTVMASQAETVKKGKTSTVYLEVSGGSGTAFCIHSSGLFITNAHVVEGVSSSEKVTLILNSGEAKQKKVKARVVRTDAQKDLALLQADRIDGGFQSLAIGDSSKSYETQQVYTFGFPLGSALSTKRGASPAISVTMGRINSLRKKDGELDTIQLDAVLTQGNSGGPVLNEKGEVVGVVVSGVMGLGLNFAIPTNKLLSFLKKPHIEPSFPKLTSKNLDENLSYKVSISSSLGKTERYDVSLTLKTSSSEKSYQLRKVGNEYSRRIALVKKASKKSQKLRALFSSGEVSGTASGMRLSQSGLNLDTDNIERIDVKGAHKVLTTDGESKGGRVSGLERVEMDFGGYSVHFDLSKAEELVFEKASTLSRVDYVLKVKNGQDEYVKEGVLEVEGSDAGPVTSAYQNKSERSSSSTSSSSKSESYLPKEEVVSINGIKVVSAPSAISNVIQGGGGGYLVLSMPKLKKLAVFSIAQSKIINYISTPESNVYYAVGRTKLIMVAPNAGIISRYNLITGEKELTKKLPFSGVAQRTSMGMNTEGPLLVRWAIGTSALDRAHYSFLDISSFKLLNANPLRARNSSYRNQEYLRSSADGSVIGAWCTSHSPSGLLAMVNIDNTINVRYDHTSVGHVVPNASGDYLFTGKGIYTNELKRFLPQFSNHFVPAIVGNYFFGLVRENSDRHSSRGRDYGAMDVFSLGTDTPLAKHAFPKEVGKLSSATGFAQKSDFTMDKRINFNPSLNRIVYIPQTNDKLVVEVFSIEAILRKSGIDYLFAASQPHVSARPGSSYRYPIEVLSKNGRVSYVLESGPSGMRVSNEGVVTWSVPRSFDSEESVIVLVRDGSGQEIFHSFTIKPQS